MLVSPKAVDIRVKHVEDSRQPMQILTLMALGAQSSGKEKAEIRARCLVCTSITAVFANIASRTLSCFREVSIFSVAARPFVVPDVEDSPRLMSWLGFQG